MPNGPAPFISEAIITFLTIEEKLNSHRDPLIKSDMGLRTAFTILATFVIWLECFGKSRHSREKFWQKQEQHLGRSVGGPGGISWGPEKSPWKGSPDSHEGNLLFSYYLSFSSLSKTYFVLFCLTNWICICKNVAKRTKLKSRKSEQIWQLAAS